MRMNRPVFRSPSLAWWFMTTDSDAAELCEPFVIQGRLFTLLNDSRVGTYDYFDSGSMVVVIKAGFCMLARASQRSIHTIGLRKLSILFSQDLLMLMFIILSYP